MIRSRKSRTASPSTSRLAPWTGGDLIQTLLKHRLIDELRLWVFPIVLGAGKRLFGQGTVPTGFELVETQRSTTGALLQVYRAGRTLEYGSFQLEPPTAEEIARRARMGPAAG